MAVMDMATRQKVYRRHFTALKGIALPTPKQGYVAGLGKVQVLSYHGNGYWLVLTNRDQRYLKHRNAITFTL